MKLVDSSNVAAIGHNGGSLLTVKFKNGSTYEYKNVTPEMHRELMTSDSHGSWIAANLVRKPLAHPAKKLGVKRK